MEEKNVTFRLSVRTALGLKLYAAARRMTISDCFNEIVESYLTDRPRLFNTFKRDKEKTLEAVRVALQEDTVREHEEVRSFSKIIVKMEGQMRQELNKTAELVGMSIDGLIRLIIEDHLERGGIDVQIIVNMVRPQTA